MLNVVGNDMGQIACIAGHHQSFDPTLHAFNQHLVFGAMTHHVHHAQLKRTNFFAQHFSLTLLQTHRTVAMWAVEFDGGQQLGMTLKKVRCVHQKMGDVVFGNRVHGCIHVCLLCKIKIHYTGRTCARHSKIVGQGDFTLKHRGCRAGHAHRVTCALPLDGQHTAVGLHLHFGV